MPNSPEVMVFVCANCFPADQRLPRQWMQRDVHVQTREVPCSGKTDAQYLFHALESGIRGLALVTCEEGACSLAEGNYRARIRIRTVRRLLAEVGVEPERVELLRCGPGDQLGDLVRGAVDRIVALGESPLAASTTA